MEGRMTGTRGSARAAAFVAAEMRSAGLVPAGDSGYLQRLPLVRAPNGRPTLAASFAARDTFPVASRLDGGNLIGVLPGSDPGLRDEIVLVSAHYDHVGIRQAVNGDSIYNGADDNASGVVTILEVARLLRTGAPPKRTVVFVAFTGEELGGLGTRWYLQHPVRPLEGTVANLNVEMTGRPDSLAGGPGKAWLTGFERSNMGEQLAAGGISIVADPRPSQNFFQRSDNYAFALRGIVAHTLSTFNLHTDYHRPGDSADKADPAHMAVVIEAATQAVRILADGPRPEWKPGGKPERR
jgi:Zn-dependent M28 family amino/carboxypeptidase